MRALSRSGHAISVAGRLGDDEEARVFSAAIENLMRRLWGNGEAGRWHEPMLFAIELDGELAGEHIEELCCTLMEVTLLGGGGRHALFDDAQRIGAMEMPAVAGMLAGGTRPGVVLGVAGADGTHGGDSCDGNNGRETIG